MRVIELKEELVAKLAASDKVKGIGQTGSIDAKLIPGKSDIDLFVLCTEVPSQDERKEFYSMLQADDFTLQMEVCSGGQWGTGDILIAEGIDVMPMYFTINEMQEYLEEVLQCKHLYKNGRFYPVGRLASISSIYILHEKNNTWTALKNMVNLKPVSFFQTWFKNEISQVLDEEDLGRAELRKETLFYHQVLENALDHLLQALYAINDCYFPSRKRTLSDINGFLNKPGDCCTRLLSMVIHGATSDTINQSIEELRCMTHEIYEMGAVKFGLNK